MSPVATLSASQGIRAAGCATGSPAGCASVSPCTARTCFRYLGSREYLVAGLSRAGDVAARCIAPKNLRSSGQPGLWGFVLVMGRNTKRSRSRSKAISSTFYCSSASTTGRLMYYVTSCHLRERWWVGFAGRVGCEVRLCGDPCESTCRVARELCACVPAPPGVYEPILGRQLSAPGVHGARARPRARARRVEQLQFSFRKELFIACFARGQVFAE